MTAGNFSRPGAIDLSALARPTGPAAPPGAAPGGAGAYVVDVTEQSFQADVVNQSLTVPVVLDFWADWCEPCRRLSPVLEKLAGEYAGRFVLGKVDVEANQQLAAAVGAQSIPLVIAVVGGQPVPLFQGALPEADVRQYLEELLKVAAANGITGTAAPRQVADAGEAVPPEAQPVGDPALVAAEAALARGDHEAAVAAYQAVLAQRPADPAATAGLARAQLLARTSGLDATAVRAAAAADPEDIASQVQAADLDLVGGHVDDAFDRLLELISRTVGSERDQARRHLLEHFAVVGDEDPRVSTARRRLANALF
jgi:putative thioredoxin